jgi:MFS family permease
MARVGRLLGLSDATSEGLHLAVVLATLIPVFSITFQLSTTFWMIFIAEQLGNGDYLVGLELVGILLVIQNVVQTLLDYPTGSIGDTIGHKYVIASALVCYAIAYWITSLARPDSPFLLFALIYIFLGLGASQESGAWGAWFDNNYRIAMPNDVDRKQYGVFQGRLGMLSQIFATVVIIPGSIIALIMQRTWVFQLQGIMLLVLAAVILRVLNDLPGARPERNERPSYREYLSNMKEGITFLGSSRFIAIFVLGEVVLYSVGPVWGSLLLWPLYFAYLFSDIGVSGFRTLMFAPLAGITERSGVWAKKYDPVKWAPRFTVFGFVGATFSGLLTIIITVFPPPAAPGLVYDILIPGTDVPLFQFPASTIIPMFLIAALFIVTSLLGNMGGILTQRVLIDVIPNRIRNGLYSLRSSLIILASLPLMPFFGWLTPTYGYASAFICFTVITSIGSVLIWKAFKCPIPKARDLEVIEKTAEAAADIVDPT